MINRVWFQPFQKISNDISYLRSEFLKNGLFLIFFQFKVYKLVILYFYSHCC